MATEFTLFPRLPTEIRLQIWQLCLPQRICELEIPKAEELWESMSIYGLSPCTVWQTSNANRQPPLISQVSREARQVAAEASKCVPDLMDQKPTDDDWHVSTIMKSSWHDSTRDIVHSNWWGYRVMKCEGIPLLWLIWEISKLSGTGSMMFSRMTRLTWEEGIPWKDGESEERELKWAVEELAFGCHTYGEVGVLNEVPTWLVVIRVIVIHCDRQRGSGFDRFGLLGDAPIQIVDVANERKIDDLYQLAQECEGTLPGTCRQDFFRESSARTQEVLSKRLRIYTARGPMSSHQTCGQRLCSGFVQENATLFNTTKKT